MVDGASQNLLVLLYYFVRTFGAYQSFNFLVKIPLVNESFRNEIV